MNKLIAMSALAAALVATSTGFAQAQSRTGTSATTRSAPGTTATGGTATSSQQQGANKKGFCPPGQQKKAGKGSSFQC